MTPTLPLPPEDERRFRDALPDFLAGRLDASAAAWMRQQRQRHPALDDEARTLEQLRQALRDEAAREDTGAAWQQLQRQLDPRTQAPARAGGLAAAWRAGLATLGRWQGPGLRPALALASVVIGVQAGAIGWLLSARGGAEDAPVWRGASPAALQEAPRAMLWLDLAPDAPAQALAPLLAPQAGGPRQLQWAPDGRWQLSLPADEAPAALAAARALPAVRQAGLQP